MSKRTRGIYSALIVTAIAIVAVSVWASVVPTTGVYLLTTKGTTATSDSTVSSVFPSLVYVNAVDSTIGGLIQDSAARNAQTDSSIGEINLALTGNGDISGTRKRYYWGSATGSDSYTTSWSGQFSAATYAYGTWSSSYYTSGTWQCSQPVGQLLQPNGTESGSYWLLPMLSDSFATPGVVGTYVFGPGIMSPVVGAASMPESFGVRIFPDSMGITSCTAGLRLLVFNDSTGLVSDSRIAIHPGCPAAGVSSDSVCDTTITVVNNTITRVYLVNDIAGGVNWFKKWTIVPVCAGGSTANYVTTALSTLTCSATLSTGLNASILIPAGAIGSNATVTTMMVGQPNGPKYLQADTVTGFYINGETTTASYRRLTGTTFSITALSATGNPVQLAAGKTFIITVDLTKLGLNIADTTSLRLLRLNEGTGAWVLAGSDQTNDGKWLICKVDHLSTFALGVLPVGSSAAADDSNNCVITKSVFGTSFTSVLPALRSVRDLMMTSSIGRLLVSGYYSAGILMLIAAGFGLTVAMKRR